ncbi:protein mono-ADP-ribosyltransferase PARP12-like [Chanos chanos]|uniref:Protein mono-ADP-ribosyltransferase PARP12-like n=1 Tax=Chanos chanos TaxID=29144 RepID=A0A6J2WPH8_CHACN|nr:protein mono-ADP-ribosyltransferase PARP12-like [Chanos chanos]
MSSTVYNVILKIICQNQGSVDFKQLDQKLRQHFAIAREILVGILQHTEKFVIVAGKEDRKDLPLSPDSLIIAKTSLRVCLKVPDKGVLCEDLHLCRYFLYGKCKFGVRCKNPHTLDTLHNATVLKRAGLQQLQESELFVLLLQNDPTLLPEVCSHYNKGSGEHGSCKYKESCSNLHVCQHFLQDNCRFGETCRRAHRFDAGTMKILNDKGFTDDNIHVFQKIYKNKFLIANQRERPAISSAELGKRQQPREDSPVASGSPISDADRNEICLFFIRRGCSFKEKCVRVHYHLPYRWQVLDKDGVTWKDLPNGEDIEKAFCNPANDSSSGNQPVDFVSMTCGGLSVRRLSTASSVTKPPNFILTTEWRWYWKNDKGGWTEYGQGEDPGLVSSTTSQTLENVYLADNNSEIPFSSASHKYIIRLKEMCQKNLFYGTSRQIRRRPVFVSPQEVEKRLKGESSETSSSSTVEVPAHWDKAALPSFSYKLVPLSETEAEFQTVEKLFKATMPKFTIVSIKRNQNSSLWRVFQWQKEQMKGRNGGGEVDERLLFHGTDQALVDAICEQNFDWRICGTHGTVYGKGSYFARDASYSHHYVHTDSSTKTMFVARVLVGRFTKGQGSFVRPPAKPNGTGLYDSCVDSMSDPSIFVIFEKYQIYPEFVIEYTPETSRCLIS